MTNGLTPASANPAPVVIHTDTMADVIGFLPKGAADRLRMLRQQVADLHLVVPLFEERQTANTARYEAEKRLERLQTHPQNGGFGLPDTDRRVADQKREVKRLADDARRITDRYTMRSQAWTAAGQTLAHVESWLHDGKPAGVAVAGFHASGAAVAQGRGHPYCRGATAQT